MTSRCTRRRAPDASAGRSSQQRRTGTPLLATAERPSPASVSPRQPVMQYQARPFRYISSDLATARSDLSGWDLTQSLDVTKKFDFVALCYTSCDAKSVPILMKSHASRRHPPTKGNSRRERGVEAFQGSGCWRMTSCAGDVQDLGYLPRVQACFRVLKPERLPV